jgi:hypothetical protein
MKTPAFLSAVISSFFLLAGCERPNQEPVGTTPAREQPEENLPMPGSYQTTELTDELRAVAEFAVLERGQQTETPIKLIEIIRVERQIVAGTNYQLQLTVEQEGATRKVSAVVFEDLESKLELSSWEEKP